MPTPYAMLFHTGSKVEWVVVDTTAPRMGLRRPSVQDALEDFMADPENAGVPLVYGKHVTQADEQDRPTQYVEWARLDGVLYRVMTRVYYGKKNPDSVTWNINVRAKSGTGYVWASANVRDDERKVLGATADAILLCASRAKDAAEGKPVEQKVARAPVPRTDRALPNVEAWN